MFEQLLEKVSLALDKVGIPYMVIGGQAVLLYGEPRLTRDIDITLGTTLEKLDVVLGLVENIGLKSLEDPETFTRKTMVLPCQDPSTSIRIDFIFSFSAYEQQALERVRSVKRGNAKVLLMGRICLHRYRAEVIILTPFFCHDINNASPYLTILCFESTSFHRNFIDGTQ